MSTDIKTVTFSIRKGKRKARTTNIGTFLSQEEVEKTVNELRLKKTPKIIVQDSESELVYELIRKTYHISRKASKE